jgi:predicted RNase H-like HicB family nuclease
MLTNYIQAAMRRAEYETLEDGTVFGRIPGFQGVWANAPAIDDCREELQEVLEDWILVGLRAHHHLPTVEGIDLNIADVA